MAIHRGLQSAIFYYISCAPCYEARHLRKRKEEAARSRAERELLEKEHPNLYRHPSPSSTNPYWETEIALGPTLAARGKRKTYNGDARRRVKDGRLSANASGEPSYADLPFVNDAGEDQSKWNFRPYQREDEELWGSTSQFGGSVSGDSITRPQKAKTIDSHGPESQSFRNPPINDLHPAIVTKVASREEVMWMMQPPPVAEVMSGKERVPRSRSDSGGSRMSPRLALSRQVSNRLIQQKLNAGEASIPMSREGSSRTTIEPNAQRPGTDFATSERDFAIDPIQPPSKLLPSPILLDNNGSKESSITVLRRSSLVPEPNVKSQAKHSLSRGQLSTIVSDNDSSAGHRLERPSTLHPPNENDMPRLRHSDDAFDGRDRFTVKVVQDLKPRSSNGKVIRTVTAPESNDISLRHMTHGREDSDDTVPNMRPEMFDSWYTSDFELTKYVHEVTKREVKQRWSMEF